MKIHEILKYYSIKSNTARPHVADPYQRRGDIVIDQLTYLFFASVSILPFVL